MNSRAGVVLLAAACLALGLVLGHLAGRAPDPPPSYLARLTGELGLRPEQVAAIERILQEEDAELAALVSDHRRAMREPVAERRERTEAELLAVLDADQRMRYDVLTSGGR